MQNHPIRTFSLVHLFVQEYSAQQGSRLFSLSLITKKMPYWNDSLQKTRSLWPDHGPSIVFVSLHKDERRKSHQQMSRGRHHQHTELYLNETVLSVTKWSTSTRFIYPPPQLTWYICSKLVLSGVYMQMNRGQNSRESDDGLFTDEPTRKLKFWISSSDTWTIPERKNYLILAECHSNKSFGVGKTATWQLSETRTQHVFGTVGCGMLSMSLHFISLIVVPGRRRKKKRLLKIHDTSAVVQQSARICQMRSLSNEKMPRQKNSLWACGLTCKDPNQP
jgi:hypothetical protein